jgi:hypothetical protein
MEGNKDKDNLMRISSKFHSVGVYYAYDVLFLYLYVTQLNSITGFIH